MHTRYTVTIYLCRPICVSFPGKPPNNTIPFWTGLTWGTKTYGTANGLATLGGTGRVPAAQLPVLAGFSRLVIPVALSTAVALDDTWLLLAHFTFDGAWVPGGATVNLTAVMATTNPANATNVRIYDPGLNSVIGMVATTSLTPSVQATAVTFPSGFKLYEAQLRLANASPAAQASCTMLRIEIS